MDANSMRISSSPTPARRRLYLDLIEARHLPDELLRDIRNMRTFSTAFKINVACERPPRYPGLQKAIDDGALGDFTYPTYVHCAPDIDYLEQAYDDAKHGWYSSSPFLTPVAPSVVDDTLAPEGKHVVNLFGGHAPYELKNGRWEDERENFTKNVFRTLDRFAPGFSDDIIATEVLLAPDIEARVNLPQGHIFHGELALDQLFFKRPARTTRTTEVRSKACTCADQAAIPAAASPASPATTPRGKSCGTCAEGNAAALTARGSDQRRVGP